MAYRDASRITIQFPAFDNADSSHIAFTACVFDGPNWSGFERPATETTCSNATADAWGNLIRTYGHGTVVEMGTIELTVDWDTEENSDIKGGDIYSSFKSHFATNGDYVITLPAQTGESTGPKITFKGVLTNFTPQGTVLGTEDEARWAASVTIQISGDLTFTAAT